MNRVPGTAPPPPNSPVLPSMIAASHSTVPSRVRLEPVPAFIFSSSSNSTIARSTTDRMSVPGIDDTRRASVHALFIASFTDLSEVLLWCPAPACTATYTVEDDIQAGVTCDGCNRSVDYVTDLCSFESQCNWHPFHSLLPLILFPLPFVQPRIPHLLQSGPLFAG